jgi:SAM-dependent methyltransferase
MSSAESNDEPSIGSHVERSAGDRVERETSFGEGYHPSSVDRFGVWLSSRQIHRRVDSFDGRHVGDFGCGYHATFVRSVLDRVESAVLIDVSLADDLKSHAKISAIEGTLPTALERLPDASLDVVLCTSVIEHLWEPQVALDHLRRITAPGGICLVNVPSWLGKRALEFAAFRLGVSPRAEMDDHKIYFDPRDLWPLLVRAGFTPHNIKCFRHKGGLNTFAVLRVDPTTPTPRGEP